jgi:isocitrate dehydrogenase
MSSQGVKARARDRIVVPVIPGDGIGPEIWQAAQLVLDAAVTTAYRGNRAITWREVAAGAEAIAMAGEPLPPETLRAFQECGVGIKGPLGTEVGRGARSPNVALRQTLDLYACVRPVRHIDGAPSPVREPGRLDIVIFRENTEDVYAGIEWAAGSAEADRLRGMLEGEFGARIAAGSALGIKPMSERGSKRLVRAAIRYAIEHGRPSVTLVHKGNIMKYTEGAFRDWGYEVAKEEFGHQTVPEDAARGDARGLVVIKDRIADAMFQELLLAPDQHSVLATPNLNGDYLSDAAAAQVGGLGLAPGANIGDMVAVFEPTHGTAPRLAGQGKANPTAMILCGAMLLDHVGWTEAAAVVRRGVELAVQRGQVTEDLARHVPGASALSTSDFARAVVGTWGRQG